MIPSTHPPTTNIRRRIQRHESFRFHCRHRSPNPRYPLRRKTLSPRPLSVRITFRENTRGTPPFQTILLRLDPKEGDGRCEGGPVGLVDRLVVSALSSARVSVGTARTLRSDVGLSLVTASLLKEPCGSGPLELCPSRAYRYSEWHWHVRRRAGGSDFQGIPLLWRTRAWQNRQTGFMTTSYVPPVTFPKASGFAWFRSQQGWCYGYPFSCRVDRDDRR